MENDDDIESDIERKKKKQAVQRIKHGMLGVCQKRMTCELEGIPQRKITMLYTFDPEESRWDEIGP
jgi:hypothetical protein